MPVDTEQTPTAQAEPVVRVARARRASGSDSSDERPAAPRRNWVLWARSGAVLAVVVILLMTLALPAKAYITQRSRIASLESQLAWHNQRIADLTAAHQRWSDPAYVEAQARARLHYVRVGQVGYVVLTDQGTHDPEITTTRPQADIPRTGPWWSALWGTVEGVATPKSSNSAPAAPAQATPAPSYGG